MGRQDRTVVLRALTVLAVAGSWCWISAAPSGSAGVTAATVTFGQSACFSGPNAHLGIRYQAGIEAAFRERNELGGIHGRSVELVSVDDAYEPGEAAENAERFVAQDDVLAVVGGIGTPTAKRIAPILRDGGVPFVGLFTGAAILRNSDRYPNVVNVRASYRQEIDVLVEHMVKDLGKRRFGVIYQDDAFGRSVLADFVVVLEDHDLRFWRSPPIRRTRTRFIRVSSRSRRRILTPCFWPEAAPQTLTSSIWRIRSDTTT